MRADADAVREWLVLLHGGSEGLLHLCWTRDWTGMRVRADDIDTAVRYVLGKDAGPMPPEGAYLRATTLIPDAPTDHGARAGAAFSATLPGLWADIDLAGPGHKHKDNWPGMPDYNPRAALKYPLPPDEDAGRRLVEEAGLLKPTLWVHSGGGLYPWWLLTEPKTLAGDAFAMDAAMKLSDGWQRELEAAAHRLELDYGNVGDLARVLRIPGTVNRKEGLERPCRIIEQDGPTYSFDELAECLLAAQTATAGRVKEAAPVLQPVAPYGSRPPARLPGALQTPPPSTGPRQGSPLDAFELSVPWDAILVPLGWQVHHVQGSTTYWTRPGKAVADGHSATTGHSTDGRDRMWVFSTECGLPVQEPLTKPYVWGVLNGHGGNMAAVAKALVNSGFGTPVNQISPLIQLSQAPATRPAQPPNEAVISITVEQHGVAAPTAPTTPSASPAGLPSAAATPTYNPPPAAGWHPAPVRPGDVGALPVFPLHALPPAMHDLVVQVAGSRQVDPIMPALFALAAVSAVAAGRLQVRRSGDWFEPLSLYTCAVAESGERKSPTGRAVFGAIHRIERQMAAAHNDEVDKLVDELDKERAEARGNPALANRIEDKINAAQASRKRPPRVQLANDITPEALVRSLAALGGHGAILDPEGTFMGILSGRYSNGLPNPELIIKAYDGDTYSADRISRDPDRIERPTLALGLAVQRIVLEDAMANKQLLERGALARIIYGFPRSLVGTRFERGSVAAFDGNPGRVWALTIEGIAELPAPESPDQVPALGLAPDALLAHIAFSDQVEARLGPGGDLTAAGLKEWSHKHAGRVLRIAALLHLAAGFTATTEIQLQTVRAAIDIGEWAIEHARHAHRVDRESADEATVRQCNQVIDWLVRTGQQAFTIREACRGLRSQWVTTKAMEDAVDQLAELGWVREEPYQDRSGRWRKRFAVSPHASGAAGAATMSPGMP